MSLNHLSRSASSTLLPGSPGRFVGQQCAVFLFNNLSSVLLGWLQILEGLSIELLLDINFLWLCRAHYAKNLRLKIEFRCPNFEFCFSSCEGLRVVQKVNWSQRIANNITRHRKHSDIRMSLYFLNLELE